MRIKGFTILELMVVMALTGLVMAIVWGVYANFRLFGNEYEARNGQSTEWILMDQILRKDCREAKEVWLSGDSLRFDSLISYQVAGPWLERSAGVRRDSFEVPMQGMELEDGQRVMRLSIFLGPDPNNRQAFIYSIPKPASVQNPPP